MIVPQNILISNEEVLSLEQVLRGQFSITISKSINTFRKVLSDEKNSEVRQKLLDAISCWEKIQEDFDV